MATTAPSGRGVSLLWISSPYPVVPRLSFYTLQGLTVLTDFLVNH